jgi:hypothetical protein
MKVDLVRAPIVIGSLIAGALALMAVLALLVSSPRWDDHLLNAVGVLAVAAFLSLTLRLATGAFRRQPGAPRRARLISIAWLVALASLTFIAIQVAMFIDDMSFL